MDEQIFPRLFAYFLNILGISHIFQQSKHKLPECFRKFMYFLTVWTDCTVCIHICNISTPYQLSGLAVFWTWPIQMWPCNSRLKHSLQCTLVNWKTMTGMLLRYIFFVKFAKLATSNLRQSLMLPFPHSENTLTDVRLWWQRFKVSFGLLLTADASEWSINFHYLKNDKSSWQIVSCCII